MDPRIAAIEKDYMRNDLPAFSPGDTVRVRVRVREGGKERIQPFEGICIGKRGAGVNATFTLRRVSGGVGVERIFPMHSPWIAGVEIVRRGDVRRAKLYYLRSRVGKRARVRERKWWLDKPTDTKAPGDPIEGAAEMADEGADEGPVEEAGGLGAAVAGAVDSVQEAASDLVEKAGDVAEAVGDKVEDMAEAAGDVVEDVVDKVKDVAEDVAEAVEDVIEDVVEKVKGDDDDDEERSAEE
jgi:large subunit ribosomal protein L19